MNVERMLRIAKEQSWWESFIENMKGYYKSLDEFLKRFDKESIAKDFFIYAFIWDETKEGRSFWAEACKDTCKKYHDTSVKVFKEDITYEPVAIFIGSDTRGFKDTLVSHKISFDAIRAEGKYLTAYKITYKIVEEWI